MKTEREQALSTLLKVGVAALIFASLAFSFRAGAADIKEQEISFLPAQTESQRAVRSAILEGEFKTALLNYEGAYGSFVYSATGEGFYNYLLFLNGMRASAVEKLFLIKNPRLMADSLQSLWRKTLPASSPVWREVRVTFTKDWTRIFSEAAKETYGIATIQASVKAKDVKQLQKILARNNGSDANSLAEKAWLRWQIALNLGIQGKTKEASTYLQALLESGQTTISEDQVLLAAARMLYQDNKLEGALKYYNLIPKSSDLWLEAVEEKAWAFMKMKDYERALAQVKTLRAPVFAAQVGPEPYFLAGFANYKVCDYNAIFKILKDFKERFRTRLTELENLAQSGRSSSVDAAVAKIESGASSWSAIGSVVEKLPRVFNRDAVFMTAVSRHGSGKQDVTIATELASQGRAGLKARLEDVKRRSNERRIQGEKAYTTRMKTLAAADVKEMSDIIDKMLILQVESIQHLHADHESLAKNKEVQPTKKPLQVSKDDLVFPDTDEVWLDELDNYHVHAKGCPSKGGKKL